MREECTLVHQGEFRKVQLLIDTLTEFNLQMALLKDVLMLCTLVSGNYTRPDNVFTSTLLTDAVVHCKTLPEEHPARSDHIPVTTHIIIRAHSPDRTPPAKL